MKVVLTIAGTDPSGAAGIQADLQVMRDHGVHGVSVITAVLAQNTQGVRRVEPMSPDVVTSQIDAIFEDFDVAAIKIGLVPDDEVLDVVAHLAGRAPAVWDPVLASGDGVATLFDGTRARMLDALRTVQIVTPNVPEISALDGTPVTSRADALEAAARLSKLGPYVLLKTGHLERAETMLQDIWAADGEAHDLQPLPAINDDVRGTGCQLSSAIACNLAAGQSPIAAAESARAYLNELLRNHALRLGQGRRLVVRGGSPG